MGKIGPRQQRYEVLPDVLDLSRLDDETQGAETAPDEVGRPDRVPAAGATDPLGRDRQR